MSHTGNLMSGTPDNAAEKKTAISSQTFLIAGRLRAYMAFPLLLRRGQAKVLRQRMAMGLGLVMGLCLAMVLGLAVSVSSGMPPAAASHSSVQTGERTHLERGTKYLRQGDLEAGITSLKKAVQAGYNIDQAYFLLTRAYNMSGSYELGLRTAEEGLERFPGHTALEYARIEALAYLDPMQAARLMEELFRERGDDLELRTRGLEPHHIRAHAGHLYAMAGSGFHASERLDEAAKVLEKARSLIPDSLYVHNNLVYTLIVNREYDRAAEAAKEALQRFPDDRNIRLLKNQALSLAGRGEDGFDMVEALYREDPDDPEAAIAYGQALLRAGRMQDAADHFDDYLDRNPKQRRVYDVLARMNRQQYQYRHLAQVLERKTEAFPDEWHVRRELAEVLGLIEEFEKAHEEYEMLYEHTGDPLYPLLQARLYLAQQEYEQAAKQYERMIAEHGESWTGEEAYEELVLLWMFMDETERALNAARQGRQQHGHSTAIRERQLEALWVSGDRNTSRDAAAKMEAQSLFRSGLAFYVLSETESDPDIRMEWLARALEEELAYSKQISELFGERAQSQLSGQIELHYPVISEKDELQRRQKYLEMMADKMESLMGPEERIHHYRGLLNTFDGSVWVMQQAARALLESGEMEQATRMLNRAARSVPGDPDIHRQIAAIHEQAGNIRGALHAWERALSADNEMEEAYSQLIRLHRQNGTLDGLCDRWMARHRADRSNELLAEYLVDALHRAGRYEEAREITQR